MALLQLNRSLGRWLVWASWPLKAPQGMIFARDDQGELVTRIPTGPGFGERLATAFYAYRQAISDAKAASTTTEYAEL